MKPMASGKVGRILISNDDGINAAGLKVLEDIAASIAQDVWVFAPDDNCSGYGRALTLKRDLNVTKHAEKRFSCDGTPADCMVLALNHFMKSAMPDLVLSGVNLGMNIADDITCSGTIGAAWEATVHGIPSIAVSQKINRQNMPVDPIDAYTITRAEALPVLTNLIKKGWAEDVIMNINFPSDQPKGIKPFPVGRHKASDEILPSDAENAFRIGLLRQRRHIHNHDDYFGIMNDYITVTPLALNMTSQQELDDLKVLFDDRNG
ncbi:MAG: 5'/3'-nucleotidase SurE [Candidatus Puniceispirillum sp. TMED52]|nr:5'/3'-nucleotidase SurE [SAR116 cluster bacterium]OUU55469.1 MAG: 5'/3'-nucleotidase SurE [Candidatus Puniceispirillum sp. TMED52]HCP18640.1 5'/3'-nucleotidase SurE [Alphaproteobacteria bacterium]